MLYEVITISPAWNSGGKTLNEHGMGMKQAIAGLGELSYLATKTEATNPATVITEFKFGNVTPLNCDVACVITSYSIHYTKLYDNYFVGKVEWDDVIRQVGKVFEWLDK